MTANVSYDDVHVDAEIGPREFSITRLDLVKYCGASGDFNVIHWNERVAVSVGLPNVVAHGMFTMAQVARLVTDWCGDPGALVEYRVRFSRPVLVPDDDIGATLTVKGRIENKLGDRRVSLFIEASTPDGSVLTGARAIVQLA
ncbi:MAG: MaoC/PaaZ C-terminal domain-containing protein [Actinomycetota bacterium]